MTNREAHQRNLRKGRFSQMGCCYFITTGDDFTRLWSRLEAAPTKSPYEEPCKGEGAVSRYRRFKRAVPKSNDWI